MPAIHDVAAGAVVVTVLAAANCHGPGEAAAPSIERLQLEHLASFEISGTASDPQGRLWVVAERERLLMRLDDPRDEHTIPFSVSIAGIPPEIELESLTMLEEGLFAVGGETGAPRDEGPIFVLRVENDRAQAVARWSLPWSLFGIAPRPNQGIEALCSAGPFVVAGLETPLETAEGRWGLLAMTRRDGLGHHGWVPFRLRLGTAEGKLSALDCYLDEDEIEAVAVERHYGTARLLRFELATKARGGEVVAEPELDLGHTPGALPNMEGVSASPRGIYIMTDRGAHGATENLVVGPFDDDD